MSLVDRALRNAEQHALAELFPTPNPYVADPVGWVHERLGEPTWSEQDHIMRAVIEHPKVVVVSCNGVGKDWTGGRVVGHWVDVHPPNRTLVATTAPTGDQVRGIIWQELVTVKAGGASGKPLDGRVNQTEWWNGPHQVGIGRKTADHAAAASLGFHADFLLIVIDEAQGVTAKLIEDIERLTTADDVPGLGPEASMQRILAIGNPDYEGSTLWKMCQPDSGWYVIQIGYEDTPNFSGEACAPAVKSHLIGRRFMEDRAKQFGVDSPQYIAQVLGQFPKDATHGVIPLSWLRQCQFKHNPAIVDLIGPLREPIELGVDIGGSETGDWTVIAGRCGWQAMPYREDWHLRVGALESERITDMVLQAIRETRATSVKIDEGGVGYGVTGSVRRRSTDRNEQISWPVAVLPVNAGAASMVEDEQRRPRFANLKSEMWWRGRSLVTAPGHIDLSALDEIEVAQLTDVRYYTDAANRICIESKDDVKKRTGRSPDDADARLLSFFTPKPKGGVVQAARVVDRRHAGRR